MIFNSKSTESKSTKFKEFFKPSKTIAKPFESLQNSTNLIYELNNYNSNTNSNIIFKTNFDFNTFTDTGVHANHITTNSPMFISPINYTWVTPTPILIGYQTAFDEFTRSRAGTAQFQRISKIPPVFSKQFRTKYTRVTLYAGIERNSDKKNSDGSYSDGSYVKFFINSTINNTVINNEYIIYSDRYASILNYLLLRSMKLDSVKMNYNVMDECKFVSDLMASGLLI